ncbi:unnamed protein product [Pleuronectes platessa]|uniref:EGF-like domain-containing protein n=1 Tax=Pleuronectes platessa TaxID=8262 RepID=A0A9N7U8B3_PLEPL|nr:unnamed protein product [Pleuronectes platessa]
MSVVLDGSLFTFGAGPSNTAIEARVAIDTNSTAAPNSSTGSSAATSSTSTTTIPTTTDIGTVNDSLLMFGAGQNNQFTETVINAGIPIETNFSLAPNTSTTGNISTSATTATPTTTTSVPPVKKFVAAAVHSHFDDCPDSHRHFCFHGTCRFLILEETPACVCHQGFVGMRCEHADLLAVVATNQRQQTVATVLVLCVIGCWWRQECRRLSHARHYISEKHAASGYPSESVV